MSGAGASSGVEPDPAQLRGSVSAAAEALTTLRQGLLASGFEEALPTYQRMAEVLHAQAVAAKRADLDLGPHFDGLSRTAAEVLGTLQPWVALMRTLTALPALAAADADGAVLAPSPMESPPQPGSRPADLDEAIVDWLRSRPAGGSIAEAAEALDVTTGSCSRSMSRLSNRGRVRRGRAGGRVVWSIGPP